MQSVCLFCFSGRSLAAAMANIKCVHGVRHTHTSTHTENYLACSALREKVHWSAKVSRHFTRSIFVSTSCPWMRIAHFTWLSCLLVTCPSDPLPALCAARKDHFAQSASLPTSAKDASTIIKTWHPLSSPTSRTVESATVWAFQAFHVSASSIAVCPTDALSIYGIRGQQGA